MATPTKSLQSGFYVGPGDWLYYVKADQTGTTSSIQVAYSPNSRAWIYQTLSASQVAPVKAELISRGRYLGAQATAAKQAYAKIRPESATAGSAPASSGGSNYTPSYAPPAPSTPAAPASAWDQVKPYAPYALVGAAALAAVLILVTAPTSAPSPAPRAA